MSGCKTVSTIKSGYPKVNNDEEDLESRSLPYREVVGALMYLSVCPTGLSFTVGYLNQFCNNYKRKQWTIVKRVLRYLQGTADVGLTYHRTGRTYHRTLHGFVDAD